MSILSLPLMIEIVQISVKDNIHLLLLLSEPLKRTPTRRVLETRCKDSNNSVKLVYKHRFLNNYLEIIGTYNKK